MRRGPSDASFSAHDVFEPVRVVTSSPWLAPLFYITARSFEKRKRKGCNAKKRAGMKRCYAEEYSDDWATMGVIFIFCLVPERRFSFSGCCLIIMSLQHPNFFFFFFFLPTVFYIYFKVKAKQPQQQDNPSAEIMIQKMT